jgi:hypothetical protein
MRHPARGTDGYEYEVEAVHRGAGVGEPMNRFQRHERDVLIEADETLLVELIAGGGAVKKETARGR